MRACLEQGLGYTVCPRVSVERELAQNRLVCLDWQSDEEVACIMIWHVEKWCSPPPF